MVASFDAAVLVWAWFRFGVFQVLMNTWEIRNSIRILVKNRRYLLRGFDQFVKYQVIFERRTTKPRILASKKA